MKHNEDDPQILSTSQLTAGRVAGFMFLFLLTTILSWAFVLSDLVVADDVMATANNIIVNESLFRLSLVIELAMSVGLIVLGWALYILLERVNRSLALLALLWKLAEAIVGATIVLVFFLAFHVLTGEAHLTGFTPEQLRAPVGLIFTAHNAAWYIAMVFLGLDMTVFCYLLLKSRYVPSALAGFGVVSFAFILIWALLGIMAPSYAQLPAIAGILCAPSFLFELAMGTWLLVKGPRIP